MKILHIGMHFNPLLGGGNLRNSEIIKQYISEYDHEIHIITKVEEGFEQKLPEYLKGNGQYKNVHCHFFNSSFDQVKAAIRLCRKIRFDVVHFHNQRVAFMGGFFFGKQKKILELHTFPNLSKWKDLLFRKVVDRIAHFIVLGDSGKRILCEMYDGIEESQVTVVRNGINPMVPSARSQTLLAGPYFWIAYIGTFFEWQGVYDFVESCKLFIKQYLDLPVRFIMVGGGPCFEDLKNDIMSDEVLKERIILTGAVPPTEIVDYWGAIDVTVIPRPSTKATESTEPLKLQEAVYFEKLILATDVEGLRGLLKPDYNALMSVPGDNRELAENYYRIYSDTSLREKLLTNTRETKRHLLTWKEAADKIYEIYLS